MSRLMTNIRKASLPLQESSRHLGSLLLSLGQAADATLDAEALATLEKSAEEAAAASAAKAKSSPASPSAKGESDEQLRAPRESDLASNATERTGKLRSASTSTVDLDPSLHGTNDVSQHTGSGGGNDESSKDMNNGTAGPSSSSLMHATSPSVHSVSSSRGRLASFSAHGGQEQQPSRLPPPAVAATEDAGGAPAAHPAGAQIKPPSPADPRKRPSPETPSKWPGFGEGADSDKLVICESRALAHLFTRIRNRNTPSGSFRFYASRMMRILAEEGIACLESTRQFITTPTAATFSSVFVDESNVCVVSVLRAGDALAEAAQACIPHAPVGKILIQRDEESRDKHPVLFYKKLPTKIRDMQVLLCDPMLATGGSALMAIRTLVESGVKESRVVFVTVLVCPEGLAKLRAEFPEVTIVTGAVDDCLDERKYILPGLGDFGDRFAVASTHPTYEASSFHSVTIVLTDQSGFSAAEGVLAVFERFEFATCRPTFDSGGTYQPGFRLAGKPH